MSTVDENEELPLASDSVDEGSHPKASGIKAIDRGSVHRICSGQVVLNLATAVKELVENSLDAGATNIEIRLKEYGSELLEVTDNGSGVEEDNFQGLTLKHHTSKLQDFSDLTCVDTFGFRGEALSSLCALSILSIVTCHKNAGIGTKIEFDHSGMLVQQTPHPRQQGTTVTLHQLFSTLPVRHKEFLRNLKKEFAKMVNVLNAYCIISTGVKICCTNQVGKGKKNIVVQINGNCSMKENITNIFGPKQIQTLIEFVQYSPSEESVSEYGASLAEENKSIFSIRGFVSTCEHGKGRTTTDRQFFFVNKRPCDITKVSKIVNEVYHMYNRHQYPFVVMDISLAKDAVDVNVTPDKRQIFLQREKLLFAVIKTSLIKLYESRVGIYEMNNTVPSKLTGQLTSFSRTPSDSSKPCLGHLNEKKESGPHVSTSSKTGSSKFSLLKRSFSSAFAKEDLSVEPVSDARDKEKTSKQRRLDGFLFSSSSPSHSSESQAVECSDTPALASETKRTLTILSPLEANSVQTNIDSNILSSQNSPDVSHQPPSCDSKCSPRFTSEENAFESPANEKEVFGDTVSKSETRNIIVTQTINTLHNEISDSQHNECQVPHKNDNLDEKLNTDAMVERGGEENSFQMSNEEDLSHENSRTNSAAHLTYTEFDKPEALNRRSHTVQFCVNSLRQKQKTRKKSVGESEEKCRSFRAQICPSDNQSAEEELKREISKDMFSRMKVVGQFNLGFIIAQLGQDLFIIDQHATDEKYNFEMLKKHTIIQSQKLIQPQSMELTAMNETMLIDNLDIFQKNGFEFSIDEEASPTNRVKLISLPMSKNWTFGKDDIEELLFMLCDSPGVMCRPSRIRQMFASRSCRKSIMIGTALNKSEMKKLLCHMGELEQPWNCPHGRPTMRHLINLDMLPH